MARPLSTAFQRSLIAACTRSSGSEQGQPRVRLVANRETILRISNDSHCHSADYPYRRAYLPFSEHRVHFFGVSEFSKNDEISLPIHGREDYMKRTFELARERIRTPNSKVFLGK